MKLRRTRPAAVVLLAVLTLTGCAGPNSTATPSPPPPALGATGTATDPPQGTALSPGTRYRFADVIPDRLDVELTAPDPPLYHQSTPTYTLLSPHDNFEPNGLAFLAALNMRVQNDPYQPGEELNSEEAVYRLSQTAPRDYAAYLAALPFVEVVQRDVPVTVGGVAGRAIDLRIGDMPAAADGCEIDGVPRCATVALMPGYGFNAQPGQQLRFISLALPAGDVIIELNLDVPAAQPALDSVAFVEHSSPAEFPGTRLVPSGGVLTPGTPYVVPALGDDRVAATFTAGNAPLRGLSTGNDLIIWADVLTDVRMAAVPFTDLRILDPNVDPVLLGPLAEDQSRPLPPEGLIGWLLTQPWAHVVDAPAVTKIGELPGRTVSIRAGGGAPMIACQPTSPDSPRCVSVVYNVADGVAIRLPADAVLHVTETTVADQTIAVLTIGDDPTAGSLRFVEHQR